MCFLVSNCKIQYEPFAESLQIVTSTHIFSWRFRLQERVKTRASGKIIIADDEVAEHNGYACVIG